MTQESRVFLSYSHADSEIAEIFASRLSESGIPTFFDQKQLGLGAGLFSTLRHHASTSDYVVLLLSSAAMESHAINRELAYAVERDLHQRAINFIPVRIDKVETPAYLEGWTVVDASRDPRRGAEKLVALLKVALTVRFDTLSPEQFERFVRDFLNAYGFRDLEGGTLFDFGWDFTAKTLQKDPFGRVDTVEWAVQVKAHKRSVADVSALKMFYEVLYRRNAQGLFITSGQLTTPALEFIRSVEQISGPRISVLEGTDLRRLTIPKARLVRRYFGKPAGGA